MPRQARLEEVEVRRHPPRGVGGREGPPGDAGYGARARAGVPGPRGGTAHPPPRARAVTPAARWTRVALAVAAVAVGGWQRWRAVEQLPPDFDELIYLPAAYRYAERMAPGRWS